MAEQTMQYMRAVVELGDSGTRSDLPSREDLLKDTSKPVPFVASTEGVKADGLDLKMDDWDLKRFKRYGPILWLHNYWRPPIGTGRAKAEEKLMIDVHFDEADEFAMEIRSKAIKGMMAGSVGWTTVQGKGQTQRNQLMEFSMTPMGLDPDALPAIGRMNETLREGMSRALSDTEEGASLQTALLEIRDEILTGLQTVLDEFIEEDERQETEEVEDLEEEERTEEEVEEEGRTELETETVTTSSNDPEAEEVHIFWDGQKMTSTDEVVREDSLEDLLLRAGAVLSKQNRDDLEAARQLIAKVIDRATPDNDEMLLSLEEDDDDERAEPGEAADDGLDSEETRTEKVEDEGVRPSIIDEINDLLPLPV